MNLSAGGAAAGGPGALFSPDDLACPICVETIEDAFATPCGHTFCFKCISTHLKNKSTCPSCGAHLVQDQIHPNFLLNKVGGMCYVTTLSIRLLCMKLSGMLGSLMESGCTAKQSRPEGSALSSLVQQL